MINLYNTLTKKIETFKPIKYKKVGLYSCGPTVYNFVHIGNLRAYVFVDLLKRYLSYKGFKVKHVMNITDVDDKTIRDSRKENEKLKEFTQFYFNAFIKDLKSLNIVLPEIIPMATEHIVEMVALIKKLEKYGYTYRVKGSTYFKISRFPGYGKIALLDKQKLKQNAGSKLSYEDDYKKEDASDFVLWKAWKPADGENYWETELGKGRPGWHIECSAMSMKYLGETFDIHTGGIDLIFPHHTNEIAQSEAATKKKFVNFWLHNEHLMIEGQKMAKSLHNFYTLRDEKIKKYNPLLIRLALLKTHYRQIINFTINDIEESRNIAEKFINFLLDLDSIRSKESNKLNINKAIEKNRKKSIGYLDDDLNISMFFSSMFDFMNQINKRMSQLNINQAKRIKKYIFEIDAVLGFIEILYCEYKKNLSEKLSERSIKKLLSERMTMKKRSNFKEADKIRDELLKKGIVIRDTRLGYNVKFVGFLK